MGGEADIGVAVLLEQPKENHYQHIDQGCERVFTTRVNLYVEEGSMEFDRSPVSKSLSRRSLLASAGGVALGLVSGAGRASALGVDSGQFQSSGDVAAATSAAISYLRSRTSVTTSNTFTDVSKWVYPDSRDLIQFEQNRFNSLGALGNPLAWNGVIENISSNVTVLDCSATSGEVRLSIRDWTSVQWRPALALMHRTSEQEALVQRFPEKYGLNIPDLQFTTSGFGTRHEMTLVRTSQGWLVAKDGYQEPIVALGGSSPDYVETPIANLSQLMVEPSAGLLRASTPQLSTENLLGRTFYYASAVDYAMTWGAVCGTLFTVILRLMIVRTSFRSALPQAAIQRMAPGRLTRMPGSTIWDCATGSSPQGGVTHRQRWVWALRT